jgi:cytochrome oxidase Cu insertion factor (SCO1/SenC/PrrC family)
MRSNARTSVGIAALLALTIGCTSWDNRSTAPRTAQGIPGVVAVGQPAPEITGEDVDGEPMKLSDYRGKVVMLDFWGNW